MRVNGFQCDACAFVKSGENSLKDWFAVYDFRKGVESDAQHFCSIQCLNHWIVKQMLVVEEVEVNESTFRLDKEIANNIIKYLDAKGWDAGFKIRKEQGMEGWEQLQCDNRNDSRLFHVDTNILRGMTMEQIFKMIDKWTKE